MTEQQHDAQASAASSPRVAFITLGCAKNEVDTDRMKALIAASPFTLVDDADEADVAVVNTCSFLVAAVEEGVETIFDVLNSQGFNRNHGKLVVAGCMPSRYGEDLSDELAEAAAFLPVDQEDSIVSVVADLTGVPCPQLNNPLDRGAAALYGQPLRSEVGPSTYVKISDGCDRYCSFCTIPYIRGHYQSRPYEQIADEVAALQAMGAKEVVLIGQDTGVWGEDLPEAPSIADLLEKLAQRFPDLWIRVLYLQPEGITERLLEVMGGHDNICSYFDIPVQHSVARILHDMNRSGSTDEYLQVVARIRERVPNAVLRTTVMAGFPGETDDDIDELVGFLEEARFDFTGVFAYSQEDGTVAGRRSDQVDPEVREERAERLRDVADSIGFARTGEHVGQVLEVLVESYDEDGEAGSVLGRTRGQAPEVDGQVHIADARRPDGSPVVPGDIVKVRIDDAYCYELEGEVVS